MGNPRTGTLTVKPKMKCCIIMRESSKFCQRGSNFDNVFFSWWEEGGPKYHYKRTILGPPAKRLRADDGPTLNAGLVALYFFRGSGPVLLRNPIFFIFFSGGEGGPDPLSPLWICAWLCGIIPGPAHFAKTKLIFRQRNLILEIITSDPSIYTIDHPDLTVSNFMENSIGPRRVK